LICISLLNKKKKKKFFGHNKLLITRKLVTNTNQLCTSRERSNEYEIHLLTNEQPTILHPKEYTDFKKSNVANCEKTSQVKSSWTNNQRHS
jgi:hypothetical protein